MARVGARGRGSGALASGGTDLVPCGGSRSGSLAPWLRGVAAPAFGDSEAAPRQVADAVASLAGSGAAARRLLPSEWGWGGAPLPAFGSFISMRVGFLLAPVGCCGDASRWARV